MKIDSFEKYFHPSWWKKLKPFLESKDFEEIWNKIKDLGVKNKVVYPYSKLLKEQYNDIENIIFKPFLMDFNNIELFIFSELTPDFVKKETLGNILNDNYYNAIEKSIYGGLNLNMIRNTNFDYLHNSGVFVLGNSLTAEIDLYHYPIWELFMKEVFRIINDNNKGLHIVLLGNNTHKYDKLISKNHYIYKSDINYNNYDMFSIINDRMLANEDKYIIWTIEEPPF